MMWCQASVDLGDDLAGVLTQGVVGALCQHQRAADALSFIAYLRRTRCAPMCTPLLASALRSMGARSDHMTTLRLYETLVVFTQGILYDGALTLLGCLVSLQNNLLLAAQLEADWLQGRLSCGPNERTFRTVRSVLGKSSLQRRHG